MLRGLKIFGTLLLVPFALAAFLVLMLAAVLWYYLSTLLYLSRSIVVSIGRRLHRVANGPRLPGPHFAERSPHKISVD
ncbi:MAG TPA: hypothetical protein VHR72_02795 [Gemmataceae bacterium]|jgi:hypothetical protein|nr:hypothetical protein [Gemmataceae bacterium]